MRFELGRLPDDERSLRVDYGSRAGRLTFAVDPGGARVWADWSRSTPLRLRSTHNVAGLLLGPVLGAVIRLRGQVALHGCAIAFGSRGVALLGAAGAGKSTLAAALAQRGHGMISDDVVAVDGQGLVQPGYPRLRVLPTTLAALPPPVPEGKTVIDGLEKRYLDLSPDEHAAIWRFHRRPLRLHAIYVLERDQEGSAPRIEEVEGAERLVEAARHFRRALAPLPPSARGSELHRLSRLVTAVPVRRLRSPQGLESLAATCEALVADAS